MLILKTNILKHGKGAAYRPIYRESPWGFSLSYRVAFYFFANCFLTLNPQGCFDLAVERVLRIYGFNRTLLCSL